MVGEVVAEELVYYRVCVGYGYKMVSKQEFHRLTKQLTEWNVWNSGHVVKHEGAEYVRQAVYITLQNLDKIKKPGAYFRSVLKDLKK